MRSPLMFLVLLTGCPGSSDGPEKLDDTGTITEDPPPSGCITIDGEGGFGLINDAIAAASEGAVIDICDGEYEEAVVVDKEVTLRGASTDGVRIRGPGTDIPLTLSGATGIVIETLSVQSARTGIEISAAGATLAGVTVAEAGSWGIDITDSVVEITGATLIQPAAGGVLASGGEVGIHDSIFTNPSSYGVEAIDDVALTLTGNVFNGTTSLGDSDGYNIHLDGATLTTDGNTFDAADVCAIWNDGAELVLANDIMSNTLYGMLSFGGSVNATGLTVENATIEGLYAVDPVAAISISSTTIQMVPGLACSLTYDEWGDYLVCGGMLLASPSMTVSDVTVSGYENYGITLLSYDGDPVSASLTDVSVSDTGRWGVFTSGVDATMSGMSITGMREPELLRPCADDSYIYFDRSVGILSANGDLVLDNSTFNGNAAWAVSSIAGTLEVTNSVFDTSQCSGIANFQGVATIRGNTFGENGAYGTIYDYLGITTIDGNTFSGNHRGFSGEYDDGAGNISRYGYDTGQGLDIHGYSSGGLVVTGNTFADGDSAIQASSSAGVVISGNTFTGYEGTIFYGSSGDAEFTDNVVDDSVGPVAAVSSGNLDVRDVTVGTTRLGAPVTYESYYNDVLQYAYSYNNSSTVFYASGGPGSLSLTDVTVDEAYTTLLSVYDCGLEIDNLQAGTVGGYVVSGSWSSVAPDVSVDGLTADSVASYGFYLYNSYVTNFGEVALSNVALGSVAYYGVYAAAIGELTLEDVSLGDVSGTAVQTASQTYTYTYDAGTASYIYSDVDADTVVSIDTLDVASASTGGLSLQGGRAVLTGITIGSTPGTGIALSGLTEFTLSDSTIASAGGDGVTSTDAYSYYSYDASAMAVSDGDTVATIRGTTVTDAGGSAFSFDGGTTNIRGASGTGAGGSGLDLSNTTADIQANTFTGNTGYGMTCATVTLSACATNLLTENVLGTQLDCAESCGE